MSRWAFQFFNPIILFCLLLIDSQISSFLTASFSLALFPAVHLFLIFLMYGSLQHRLPYLLIVSTIFGTVYDSYFLGVIGIAAAIFPLISLFLYEIRDTVFQNRWTRIFTTIIIVFAFEISSFGIEYGFGLTTMTPLDFVLKELAATLILNMALAAVLARPLETLYRVGKPESTRKTIKL